MKSVLKSVHNYGRYLQFCDRRVCYFHHVATRRLQLRAWPILRTGLRPVQLFLVFMITLADVYWFRSFFQLEMNWGRSWDKTCHLNSNPLPHYIVKFECSSAQFYGKVAQFKVAKTFIYSKYISGMSTSRSYSTLIYTVYSKCPPLTPTHAFELCMPSQM